MPVLAQIDCCHQAIAQGRSALAPMQQRRQVDSLQPMLAEPKSGEANPYRPSFRSNVRLPLVAAGFSVVALRDQQQWVRGNNAYQAIFDGQLYWFANQRDKDIFIAAPEKYAPILGGDCIVTFAESEERIPGDPRYGIVHQGRIYLFADDTNRTKFQENAAHYASADIANQGHCIVSQMDQQKQIKGFPQTVATYGGMRYFFTGTHQRTRFGRDPVAYGAKRRQRHKVIESKITTEQPPEELPTHNSELAESGSNASIEQAMPLAKAEDTVDKPQEHEPKPIPEGKLAMEGYCPVSIREEGVWVRGSLSYPVEIGEKIYLLAGEAQQEKFQKKPEQYAPILNGDCIVTFADSKKRIAGSVFYSKRSEDNTQLFLFLGAEEKRLFEADPQKYLKVDQQQATPAQ